MRPADSHLVALAAGGTGGHMFPAEALARELLGRGASVALVTDRRGKGFADLGDAVPVHRISGAGVTGRSIPSRIGAFVRLGLGYVQAYRLLGRLAPQVLVGFGGYASVPPGLAAAHRNVPLLVHEQNAVLGRANRLLATRAKVIATSFTRVDAVPARAADRLRETGNPVRPAIAAAARTPYKPPLMNGDLRLLVTGGSQGAAILSRRVPEAVAAVPEALRRRLSIVHQARPEDLEVVRRRYADLGMRAVVAPFFEDLPQRLAEAHLVICRAGASTVAELACAGRPAILVPFARATDDHQTKNACALEDAGAAWPMAEHEFDAGTLAERLTALAAAPERLATAAAAARSIAQADAAGRLADLVLELLPDNGEGRGSDRTTTPDGPREEAA